ncbi:MAG: PIN/TRAM domain-containing protein, partial [Deferribacterota bacterium]|nr:PIN/TRAM domain-containing protein [Deferribacterota bacterium]
LDDGSMVVIENGRKYIGKTINIEVTSLLQSDSGRIVFGKPK